VSNTVMIRIDGRDAVPLRVIPYISAWAESPDSLARALAQSHMIRVGGAVQAMAGRKVEIPNRHTLIAYHMNESGDYTPIAANQWESVVLALDSLTKKLKADERAGAEGENLARWRIEATLTLPDNTFVWFNEFQRWYSTTRPLIMLSEDDVALWKIEQTQQHDQADLDMMLDEGMDVFGREDDSLCLQPLLPQQLDHKLWRFARQIQTPSAVAVATTAEHHRELPPMGPTTVSATKNDLPPLDAAASPASVAITWQEAAWKIADIIARKKWDRNERQITARNTVEQVATELAKNSDHHGQRGPRDAGTIRKALKGWRFIPPDTGASGASGAST
jgi:hypothetical protein